MASSFFKVAVSVGELSGDQHAAKVINELKKLAPGLECKGMGGRNLRNVGVDTVVDSERFGGVMGFTDVLARIKDIRIALNTMKDFLLKWRPSILIVVDYPDFNLRLARYAKQLGIKVLYFIPPKVWAWRASRTKILGKISDCIAAIFPFEKKFYENYYIQNVSYVGHPFAGDDAMIGAPSLSKEEFCKKYSLDSRSPLVLLMPGSRKGEIKHHFNTMIAGMEMARAANPNIQAIIGVAPNLNADDYFEDLKQISWIRVVHEHSYDLMKICDAGVLKSGTCNLEAAFIGMPFVCVYKTAPFATMVAKTFVKIKEASLPNIIIPGTVRELLLERFTAKAVSEEVLALLDPTKAELLKRGLMKVREALQTFDDDSRFKGAESAPSRTARLAYSIVTEAST